MLRLAAGGSLLHGRALCALAAAARGFSTGAAGNHLHVQLEPLEDNVFYLTLSRWAAGWPWGGGQPRLGGGSE